MDFVVEMNRRAKRELMNLTVRQAKETIQRRVDQYGVAEPTIVISGTGNVKDQIIVELPGVDDPERVIGLIESTAKLELKLVHPAKGGPYGSREAAVQAFGGALPTDHEVLPDRDGAQTQFLVVRKAASITGQHLKDARRSQDSLTGRSEVLFFLNADGVRLFSRVTEQNVGNRLAIVLDKEIRSAPNIEEKIRTESARITGNFTAEEAADLSLVLRSGALPASIDILERRSVGPSLGLDSIRSGVRASICGIALVVVMMLIVYRLSAINAVACLALNLIILVGALGYFQATLTLPGIAGVILTIGMAVDANVLIFERIKEELRVGKTVRSAVEAGFDRVFWTIFDTNITTLIAALFLFQFGTGPVRGFAVTLGVGLLANIFSATYVSRTFFSVVLQRREVQKLSI
jgi:preprotein translocase subunit SecD